MNLLGGETFAGAALSMRAHMPTELAPRRVLSCLLGSPFLLYIACGLAALHSPTAKSQDTGKRLSLSGVEASALNAEPAPDPGSPWFILPSLINVYPKLESEELIEEYYNPAMRLIAPGFSDVRTIRSLRDEYVLWTPDFAIGRVLSPRWAIYLHFGYSGGKVRTKADDTSIFLLPLHTDFEIYRSAAYLGLCADVFPWGMPARKEYNGFWDRLRNTRPSVGLRLTENYAGFKAKVKAGFDGLQFLDLELDDTWWVTSFNANIGADIPMDKRNALVLNAGYNFAFSRGFDFDAAAFTVGWKHYFK